MEEKREDLHTHEMAGSSHIPEMLTFVVLPHLLLSQRKQEEKNRGSILVLLGGIFIFKGCLSL